MSLSHVVMSGKQHEHTQGSIQKIWPIGSSNVTYVIEGDTVVSGRLPILLVIRSKDGLLSYRFRDNRRFFSEKKNFDVWRRRSLSLCTKCRLYSGHSVSQSSNTKESCSSTPLNQSSNFATVVHAYIMWHSHTEPSVSARRRFSRRGSKTLIQTKVED